jgi:hypothetical protein
MNAPCASTLRLRWYWLIAGIGEIAPYAAALSSLRRHGRTFLIRKPAPRRKLSASDRARLAHRIRTGSTASSAVQPSLTSEFVGRFISDSCPGPTRAQQAVNIIRYVGDQVWRTGQRLRALPEHLFAIIGGAERSICRRACDRAQEPWSRPWHRTQGERNRPYALGSRSHSGRVGTLRGGEVRSDRGQIRLHCHEVR